MLYHIVYLGSTTHLLSQAELLSMLEETRTRKTALNVTGLLVYNDGSLLECIEGEQETVRTLFSQIRRDQMRRGIFVLFSEAIEERKFSDWSMAFRNPKLSNGNAPHGFNDFLNRRLMDLDFLVGDIKLNAFIKAFVRVHQR